MSRRYLIGASIVAHVAVAVGVFVTGVWRIERLDYDHRFLSGLAVMVPDPPAAAPAGGEKPTDPTPPKTPPKHHVDTTVQPTEHHDDKKPDATGGEGDKAGPGKGSGDRDSTGKCLENCGTAPPADPVCGNGAVEVGEACDDGNTVNGDGCSATCRTEQKKVVVVNVPPTALKRISGNTDLHPNDLVKSRILRDGNTSVRGTIKVCVAIDGSVTSANMIGTTGYAEYDATLTGAARTWRYQPVTINGTPVPACSGVTFVYKME